MGTSYSGNSLPYLFCKIAILYEKYMKEVNFLSKVARKKRAVFIGLLMVKYY